MRQSAAFGRTFEKEEEFMPTLSLRRTLSAYEAEKHHGKNAHRIITLYTIFLSFAFLIASFAAAKVTGEVDF